MEPANGFSCAASRISRTSHCSPNATRCARPVSPSTRCTRARPTRRNDQTRGPQTIEEQFARYSELYDKYEFFFVHYKYTDMYGEDEPTPRPRRSRTSIRRCRSCSRKNRTSSPSPATTPRRALKGHSWHPQPVLLHSNASGSDKLDRFTETNCNRGSLGIIEAKHLIRIMQANALMFDKFGA